MATQLNSALNPAPELSVASATTTDLGAANSNQLLITGTTTITGLGSATWARRTTRFAGALVLTHNATSLILLGGANITTAAGDVAEWASDGSGNWRMIGYTRAAGTALVSSGGGTFATVAEAQAGTSTTLMVNPAGLPMRLVGTAWIGGDMTGNARGSGALDIQSARSLVAQVAGGINSTAIGAYNQALAMHATAVGSTNTAGTYRSTAVGYSNTASGYRATAMGAQNIASSQDASAVGFINTASSSYASAVGFINTASGTYSSAFGYLNRAFGNSASAFGFQCRADGLNSSAFGRGVKTTIASTQEFGFWSTAQTTRAGAVRIHGTGMVAHTLQNTATAYTDGGATAGSEADGTLMREAFAVRRNGAALLADVNIAGTVTSYPIGNSGGTSSNFWRGDGTWATPAGGGAATLDTVNAITVPVTSNAVTNGTALRTAYAAAKILTPNGAAKSATNRAAVIVPPGVYDLVTTPLTMDTQFVDLIGSTDNPESVFIRSQCTADNSGTLVQTANDVLITGVSLYIDSTGSVTPATNVAAPCAYMPSTNLPLTKLRRVIMNCVGFWSAMRPGVLYSGEYTDCICSAYAGFGACANDSQGEASGKFTNCISGNYSFGGMVFGIASGKFINCTGGDWSFGAENGTSSGTFIGCTGGTYSFGASGTSSGIFIDCRAGDYSFGIISSGSFTRCTGGNNSFGVCTNSMQGNASGTFSYCTGGSSSFGGGGGNAPGTFTNCTGGATSFGSGYDASSGGTSSASGTFTNCVGGANSFGYIATSASGTFTDCVGGINSFGGSTDASGVFIRCTAGADSFGGSAQLFGKLIDCRLTTAFATYPLFYSIIFTVTIASPAIFDTVISGAHGLSTGNIVRFATTGALPTGLSINTSYVVTVLTSTTFKVSLTNGGAFVNTSGTQSGEHEVTRGRIINCCDGYNNVINR